MHRELPDSEQNEASNRVVRGSKQVHGPKFLSKKTGNMEKTPSGRMDRQGEVLIRCRKCSGYARQRMGPKQTNCCRPEQMDTKEFGKLRKRIQILEEGRVPAKEAKNWRIDVEKKRITRKECKRLLNNFEMEG